MGFLQKLVNLVKEELLDEPKKPQKAKKSSNSSSPKNEKPKGDSFEQLCAKAKAGDLGAQWKLMNGSDKLSSQELSITSDLFKELMDNGDIEGKCIWGFLNRETADGQSAMNSAANRGAFFGQMLNACYFGNPIALRRDVYDRFKYMNVIPSDVPDDVIIKLPVDPQNALIFLEQVATKLESCSKETQSVFHQVYGLLTYNYFSSTHDDKKIQRYAAKGAEYNDPLALFMLGHMNYMGICGYEKNMEYANQYFKNAEKHIDLLGDEGDPLVVTIKPWLYCMIGISYDKSKDSKNAAPYFEKAAKLGSLYAMFALSRYHELGILPKDAEKIMNWRTKAIAGGFNMNTCNPPVYTF